MVRLGHAPCTTAASFCRFRDIYTPRWASGGLTNIAQLNNPARPDFHLHPLLPTCSQKYLQMACQIQSSHGDKSAPRAEFGCRVSGQSFLSKMQKAAENHVSNWSDAGRSECLVLNPEHLQQRLLPANPAVDKSQERLGRKEACLPAMEEFLSSNRC